MNVSILVCAILLAIFYTLFGAIAAYVDAVEYGAKWYRIIFVFFFYWFISLWEGIKRD